MRATLIVVAVLLSMGLQPPMASRLSPVARASHAVADQMESAMGRTDEMPPVVGMAGGTGAASEPLGNLELWKFAITQGGLTFVCLAMLWWITREVKHGKDVKQILVTLVEKHTAAMVNSEATNARLARAVEAHKLMPPGSAA